VSQTQIPDKIPYVGVGCIIVRDGKLLLVRNQRGFWSTPGGHLDFGEAPDVCAARGAFEETGVTVSNVQFVAITNDVLAGSVTQLLAESARRPLLARITREFAIRNSREALTMRCGSLGQAIISRSAIHPPMP
jgi:8-oxo-dGTP pyrophosphatase MutT (NUDIX family)